MFKAGTQVVSLVEVRAAHGRPVHPRGAVGIIVAPPADPWHRYRVRFADGFEAALRQADLRLVRDSTDAPADPMAEHDLWRCVILKVVVGSRAYGLDDEASDTDRRGVYLPPAERHWSIHGVPEQLENKATDEVYWELQKFLVLGLKANPNALEVLHTSLVEHATPLAAELREMRSAFMSRLVYQTYGGYVASQFRKLQADLRMKGRAKPKHVMHLLRLLLAGTEALRTGVLPVDAGEHRERLLAVKRGEIPFEEADAWRVRLHEEFDAAAMKTTLPERPDYQEVDAFLLRARRGALGDVI
jgi:predicted nucleotidyltransferase